MKIITLTQNKDTIIDDEFYDYLSKFKWHYSTGYAKRNLWNYQSKKAKIVRMHHFILPMKKGLQIDHINGDTLDNRLVNLRYVKQKENLRNQGLRSDNTSGFKGVSKWKNGQWRAYIVVNYKQILLGIHKTKEKAAEAYNKAAKKYYKEFARLNIC